MCTHAQGWAITSSIPSVWGSLKIGTCVDAGHRSGGLLLQLSTPAPQPFSPSTQGTVHQAWAREGSRSASGWVFTTSSQLWSSWDTKETTSP